jgi:hypothetical protein
VKKKIKQLLKRLEVPDTSVSLTKGNHIKIRINGAVIITGSTPSDGRALKNLIAAIKRIK